MRTLAIVLSISFMATACGSDKGGDKKSAAVDYSNIDKLVAAAKTGDDWTNILIECGKFEIDAATKGNGKLGEDPEFNKHCGTSFEIARAKYAVSMSKPDKMHDTCISAWIGMEELIEKGKMVAEAKKLLAESIPPADFRRLASSCPRTRSSELRRWPLSLRGSGRLAIRMLGAWSPRSYADRCHSGSLAV